MTERYNDYVRPIVEEAKRRGISVRPLPEISDSYAVLEHNGRREFLCQAMTDRTGTVTLRVLYNKGVTRRLLGDLGYPVPRGIVAETEEAAVKELERHEAVVCKPVDGSFGNAVRVNLRTSDAVRRAFATAKSHSKAGKVIVEEHLPGDDHRLLVVGGERVFGVKRVPPYVIGDGQLTVEQLIQKWNLALPVANRAIKIGPRLRSRLKRSRSSLSDVPGMGARVQLADLANTHQGGFCSDVTDDLCDEAISIARRIAQEFRVALLGVDFIAEDISKDPGKLIELNPHAGITLHHQPTFGKAQNVAGAIIDMLFPDTSHSPCQFGSNLASRRGNLAEDM
jgi:cyanophycin synthetase